MNIKFVVISLWLFTYQLSAQTLLSFDKRFVESEDRWVAFPMEKDSTFPYGFIYIDAQAGLTLNYEGYFRMTPAGVFIPKKLDSTNMKVRLQPNNVKVAHIPADKFKELQIQAIPDWLKYYKTDTTSVARLYRWGFLYNGWNECVKALSYLEKAQKINPDFKGLTVELAFSYNCLGQHDKAIHVLQDALINNPTDAYTNKELIYAQIESDQLDKAAESCQRAINICTDKTYHGENCYNLLHAFYVKKNKKNFNLWLNETKKWNAANTKLLESIKTMEETLSKE